MSNKTKTITGILVASSNKERDDTIRTVNLIVKYKEHMFGFTKTSIKININNKRIPLLIKKKTK